MAVTPRIHEAAAEAVLSIEERYPGYRDALVKALDEIVVFQAKVHLGQRRDDVSKVVNALGQSAIAARGGVD